MTPWIPFFYCLSLLPIDCDLFLLLATARWDCSLLLETACCPSGCQRRTELLVARRAPHRRFTQVSEGFRLHSWIRKSTQIHTGAILHALVALMDQDQWQWVGQSSLCSCGILLIARLYFSILWIAKGQYKDYIVVLICAWTFCARLLEKQTAHVARWTSVCVGNSRQWKHKSMKSIISTRGSEK